MGLVFVKLHTDQDKHLSSFMQSRDSEEAAGVDLGSVAQEQLQDFGSVELSRVLQRIPATLGLFDVHIDAKSRKSFLV